VKRRGLHPRTHTFENWSAPVKLSSRAASCRPLTEAEGGRPIVEGPSLATPTHVRPPKGKRANSFAPSILPNERHLLTLRRHEPFPYGGRAAAPPGARAGKSASKEPHPGAARAGGFGALRNLARNHERRSRPAFSTGTHRPPQPRGAGRHGHQVSQAMLLMSTPMRPAPITEVRDAEHLRGRAHQRGRALRHHQRKSDAGLRWRTYQLPSYSALFKNLKRPRVCRRGGRASCATSTIFGPGEHRRDCSGGSRLGNSAGTRPS